MRYMQLSDKNKRDSPAEREAVHRTGRETFLFSLRIAVKRDSILSVMYVCTCMRDAISVEKLCRKLEGKAKKREELATDKKGKGRGLLEYWRASFSSRAEIARAGDFGKRKDRERKDKEREEESPFDITERETRERVQRLSRECIPLGAHAALQGCFVIQSEECGNPRKVCDVLR